MPFPSGEVAIVGVYESPRRKAPGVHPFAIQAECILGAVADAGLELGDVDGFATAAGFPSEGGLQMSLSEVAEYMGLHPRWFDGTDIGGATFISHAGHAALAIAAGLADVVVVSYAAAGYSGIPEIPFADYGTNSAGPGQFEIPYGPSTVSTYALAATRHMHDFGTTPEQLAQIAVQCRANAAPNPDARFRDPITIDEVLASPMIASPLHRLDCCIVSDSGGAFVMTSKRRAEQLAAEARLRARLRRGARPDLDEPDVAVHGDGRGALRRARVRERRPAARPRSTSRRSTTRSRSPCC